MVHLKARLISWLENNRELVVALFCLPASFLFTVALQLRAHLRRLVARADQHERAVKEIQARVCSLSDDLLRYHHTISLHNSEFQIRVGVLTRNGMIIRA